MPPSFVRFAACGACALTLAAQAETLSQPADADFAELTLGRAEDLLRAHNRDLLSARRAIDAADAAVQQADVAPNPQFSFNTLSLSPGDIAHNTWYSKYGDTAYRIDETFERGHKRKLRVEGARDGVRAAHADLHETWREQKLALTGAYYELLAAQGQLQLAEDSAHFAQQSLAAAQTRLQHGDIARSNVERIQVDAWSADNDATAAEQALVHAQDALAILIGAEAQHARLHAVSPWPSIEDSQAEATGAQLEQALDARADVRAAQARVAAASAQLQLARAERVHDVTLGAQYEHYVGDQGSGDTIGVGFSVPLFLGNRFAGDIHAAQSQLDSAEDQVERVRAAARLEIAQAQSDLEALAMRCRRYRDAILPAAHSAAVAAEFAFSHGAISVADLLDARRTERTLRIDALDADDDYAKAQAAWRASLAPEEDLTRDLKRGSDRDPTRDPTRDPARDLTGDLRDEP